MKVILWLFHLDLIPLKIFEMEEFTDEKGIPINKWESNVLKMIILLVMY